jgi:hypothetical protein
MYIDRNLITDNANKRGEKSYSGKSYSHQSYYISMSCDILEQHAKKKHIIFKDKIKCPTFSSISIIGTPVISCCPFQLKNILKHNEDV